jgi:hypothetical protein
MTVNRSFLSRRPAAQWIDRAASPANLVLPLASDIVSHANALGPYISDVAVSRTWKIHGKTIFQNENGYNLALAPLQGVITHSLGHARFPRGVL